jgi:hypothetical protein
MSRGNWGDRRGISNCNSTLAPARGHADPGEAQQEARLQATKQAYVPLLFAPVEALQFDWSEDWVRIGGVSTKLQVAHLINLNRIRRLSGNIFENASTSMHRISTKARLSLRDEAEKESITI